MGLLLQEANTRVKEARPQAVFTKTSINIRIAGILHESVVDGPGVRSVLFTQGCPHKCKGCHSPSTWSYSDGYEVSIESIAAEINERPYIDGLTISGGEPILQAENISYLVELIKQTNDLDVWIYSGYRFEELIDMSRENKPVRRLLDLCDVLVDGKYVESSRDLSLPFRGSVNQRIIELKRRK